MKHLLRWLILVPLAIVVIAFAVANRQTATVNFDPFANGPAQQINVAGPLFLVLFIVLALGVLVGGLFTWFGQGKHRRALREARSEMARLRSDIERMKT